MNPAFRIVDWKAAAPKSISVAGKALAPDQFNAAIEKDDLLVQIMLPVKEQAAVVIGK